MLNKEVVIINAVIALSYDEDLDDVSVGCKIDGSVDTDLKKLVASAYDISEDEARQLIKREFKMVGDEIEIILTRVSSKLFEPVITNGD